VRPAAADEDKLNQTKVQMQNKALTVFKKLMKPHDYQGGLYFMAKEVLLNDVGANEDKGLDVRKLKDDGFVGPDKVLVWWAEDDTDTGPAHPPWLVKHLGAEERKFTKPCGHDGATDWYHEQFLEALVRDESPAQEPRRMPLATPQSDRGAHFTQGGGANPDAADPDIK